MSFREEIKELTGENRQNPKLGFPQVVLLKKKLNAHVGVGEDHVILKS